jgi:hypothetical protein
MINLSFCINLGSKTKFKHEKLVLLSFASVLGFFLMAGSNGLPGKAKQIKLVNTSGTRAATATTNKPKMGRNGNLQKVIIGSAGNLLTVLNSASHCVVADSSC